MVVIGSSPSTGANTGNGALLLRRAPSVSYALVTRKALTDGVVALRPWRRGDVSAIVECIDGDPEITRWLDQVPQPYSRADALAYIGGIGESAFAVTDAASGRLLGSIGVRFSEEGDVGEIGYWLRADARGRGIATRSLVLIARWALERSGVGRVHLRADPENTASCRVAEKAGFRHEGVLRSAHWNARLERRQDWAMYSLLPGELE
jgi:RimJ/RimL family protein N-acetyltransferase